MEDDRLYADFRIQDLQPKIFEPNKAVVHSKRSPQLSLQFNKELKKGQVESRGSQLEDANVVIKANVSIDVKCRQDRGTPTLCGGKD
ncbi:hypothetical protein TNCV_2961141 [Trichonephila clavipes]|nr:hypothetical protein TNCV_2961141 [Trichonephila clavipes]